jgi:hypothetical protein
VTGETYGSGCWALGVVLVVVRTRPDCMSKRAARKRLVMGAASYTQSRPLATQRPHLGVEWSHLILVVRHRSHDCSVPLRRRLTPCAALEAIGRLKRTGRSPAHCWTASLGIQTGPLGSQEWMLLQIYHPSRGHTEPSPSRVSSAEGNATATSKARHPVLTNYYNSVEGTRPASKLLVRIISSHWWLFQHR